MGVLKGTRLSSKCLYYTRISIAEFSDHACVSCACLSKNLTNNMVIALPRSFPQIVVFQKPNCRRHLLSEYSGVRTTRIYLIMPWLSEDHD